MNRREFLALTASLPAMNRQRSALLVFEMFGPFLALELHHRINNNSFWRISAKSMFVEETRFQHIVKGRDTKYLIYARLVPFIGQENRGLTQISEANLVSARFLL